MLLPYPALIIQRSSHRYCPTVEKVLLALMVLCTLYSHTTGKSTKNSDQSKSVMLEKLLFENYKILAIKKKRTQLQMSL
jgi:hypothetical protein